MGSAPMTMHCMVWLLLAPVIGLWWLQPTEAVSSWPYYLVGGIVSYWVIGFYKVVVSKPRKLGKLNVHQDFWEGFWIAWLGLWLHQAKWFIEDLHDPERAKLLPLSLIAWNIGGMFIAPLVGWGYISLKRDIRAKLLSWTARAKQQRQTEAREKEGVDAVFKDLQAHIDIAVDIKIAKLVAGGELQWVRQANRTQRRNGQNPPNVDAPYVDAPLAAAMQLFGLQVGFTKEQVKERWRDIAKATHPDRPGGSEKNFKAMSQVNEYLMTKARN